MGMRHDRKVANVLLACMVLMGMTGSTTDNDSVSDAMFSDSDDSCGSIEMKAKLDAVSSDGEVGEEDNEKAIEKPKRRKTQRRISTREQQSMPAEEDDVPIPSCHNSEDEYSDFGSDEEDHEWHRNLVAGIAKEKEEEKRAESEQKKKRYVERCKKNQEAWKAGRPCLAHSYISLQAVPVPQPICDRCRAATSVVRCLDCSVKCPYVQSGLLGVALCAQCDLDAHPYAHFHRREEVFKGSWRKLSPQYHYNSETGECDKVIRTCASRPPCVLHLFVCIASIFFRMKHNFCF